MSFIQRSSLLVKLLHVIILVAYSLATKLLQQVHWLLFRFNIILLVAYSISVQPCRKITGAVCLSLLFIFLTSVYAILSQVRTDYFSSHEFSHE